MIEGAVAALKILAAFAALFAAWKIQTYIRSWYQKWVTLGSERDTAAAKEKAQADRERLNEQAGKVPRP